MKSSLKQLLATSGDYQQWIDFIIQ